MMNKDVVEYRFRKPVMINGVEKSSVSVRPLTVADMRRVNKGSAANQSVRMIAMACGIAPTDVEEFGSRVFVDLKGLVIDALQDIIPNDFVPDEEDVIMVELESPFDGDDGRKVGSVRVCELTTAQSISTEKAAKGDEFELVFLRVKASCGLSAAELERMSMADFTQVGAAVAVFFTPNDVS